MKNRFSEPDNNVPYIDNATNKAIVVNLLNTMFPNKIKKVKLEEVEGTELQKLITEPEMNTEELSYFFTKYTDKTPPRWAALMDGNGKVTHEFANGKVINYNPSVDLESCDNYLQCKSSGSPQLGGS